MQHLVADLHFRLGCNYNADIQAIFVESGSQCTPLRIGAIITTNDFTFSCRNSSQVETALSQWASSLGTVQKYSSSPARLGPWGTYCNDASEASSRRSRTKQCHRVLYCFRSRPAKGHTVCRSAQNHFKKIKTNTGLKTSLLDAVSSEDVRSFCGATFT